MVEAPVESGRAMSSTPLVICFGDSLTTGFQSPAKDNPTGRETPYGQFLQSLLESAGQVRISGICGELTGEMVTRFRRDVLDHEAPGRVGQREPFAAQRMSQRHPCGGQRPLVALDTAFHR